ncbi:KUP/HAK/KT family potassium transporter, partial [Lysobacter sp. 2RAB21]
MSANKPSHAHADGVSGHAKTGMAGLVAGAIGVVFGDIGTSPLYTLKEAF